MRRRLEDIDKLYQNHAGDPWGVDWRGTMALRNEFYEQQVRAGVKDLLGMPSSLSVLDVGCGSGVLSELLARSLASVTSKLRYLATDISSQAIAKAQRHLDSPVSYQLVDLHLTALDGQRFNVILGFEFLAYLDAGERKSLLVKLTQLREDSGIILLSSNISSDRGNESCLRAPELEKDLAELFQVRTQADLFLSQYVDLFERHLLPFGEWRWAKKLLSSRALPDLVNRWLTKNAQDDFPSERNRVYLLQ